MPTLEFIKVDQVVRVPSPDTEVTIQEIYDQIQDWLDEPSQMDIQHFVIAGGKDSLGGSEFVGVTLTLLNDWRLEFEPRLGPSTISCKVTKGNFVAVNSFSNNPIKPSLFTQVQIRQSQSPTIIETGVSGLTPTESAALLALQVDVEFMKDIEGGRWKIDKLTDQMIFFKADNLTEIARFNLFDRDGNAAFQNLFERTRV